MAQIPRLSDDVLYIISEKLLFKNRCGDIDLQSKNSFNPYTLFMNHSARNMRAVLSHFSKMKHLDLSTSDNECVIKFYKDVTPEYISHFRKSSYHVNKMIFSGLLEAGLLHISHFKITNILGQLPKIDFSATNKNIYKYLVNLAEGLFDPGSPASSNLNIYSIIVDEPAETIKKHLITLLSMNIETMEIICSNNGNMFECDAKTFELVLLGRPSISMNRTKKIKTKCTIELNSTTNFVNNLMNYIQFLLLCCLNLDSIDLDFTFNSKLKTNFYSYSGSSESTSDDSVSLLSPEEFGTNLELFFITIIDYLKNLENGGKDLKIKIEFYSSFDDYIFDLIPKNNKLFSLGKHMEIENPPDGIYYVAPTAFIRRNIEVVDSVGRQHECLVKIEGYEEKYVWDDYDNGYNTGNIFDERAYYIDAYSLDPHDIDMC
uniref:Uncharacterized protein n=1 Tax=Meloidogyne enterolobii TaxID=390850 RepID=A0A6V7XAS1_MELEN|nr:unnamed protein product [Meloidogyne enterolobii]